MRRTAGDIKINRQQLINAVVLFVVSDERPPRDGTRADGDYELGGGRCLVGCFEGQFHIGCDRPRDNQSVGVSRGGDDLDSESSEVEHDRGQNVDIRFTTVAASGLTCRNCNE